MLGELVCSLQSGDSTLDDFRKAALTLSPEQAANFDNFIRDCHIKLAAANNIYHVRRLYTDACILKSVYDTATPTPGLSIVAQAIEYLDRAIIVAGAAGPGRHDLILDLIQSIQSEHMSLLRPSSLPDVSLSATAPSVPVPVVAARHQVPRFNAPPSLASFQRSIASRPFIVTAHATYWPALNEHPWHSTRYLRTASGPGRVVPVEVGSDYRTDDWSQKIMRWDDFVTSLSQPSNQVLYLAQHSLFLQFPNMREDIVVPDYVYSCPNSSDSFPYYKPPTNDEQLVLNAWLGPKGTISPAHVDPYNNCYVQIVGRKTVWLAPPRESSALYTVSKRNPSVNKEVPQLSNTSQVDVFATDPSDEFPSFWEEVVPEAMTATLEPGDLLFFPPGWWHAFRIYRLRWHVLLIDATLRVSRNVRVLAPFNTLSCLPTFCMLDRFVRPSVEEINDVYTRLFKSTLTLSKLKDAVIGGRLLKPSDDPIGVVGRSMIWRLLLCENGPLEPPPRGTPTLSLKFWQDSRKTYVDALLDNMRAPDGSYHEGLIIPGVESLPKPNQTLVNNLDKNNPLSLDTENPWTSWFASVDLRKTILQDVERTFPDVGYFRDPEVQSDLTNILFIYSLQNPVLGYRQGMHELLALLYYACDFDSISEEQGSHLKNRELVDLLSRAWVTADAYTLFLAVMRGVGRWYEWREPPASLQKGPPSPNPGQVGIQPYVAPIVEACNRIQSTYLKSVDPDLWKHLQASGIEAQIYGIRWLRLLFTRELGIPEALLLWDGLFACDPTLELAKWICVAMLIRIRNQLIPSDYSTQLTFLLRYPLPPTAGSAVNEESFTVNHATLLLRQALSLQIAPTVATGASVVYENRNLLNIASEVPEPPPPPMKRRTDQGRTSAINDGPLRMLQRPMHVRYGSSGSLGLPDIARNLLDRGESLGINRTVMNAVSEIKRNLPDLSASFNASQYQPASFQLLDGRSPEQHPPWETRSRSEDEEVAELKKLQQKIGDSLEWILETLSQGDEGELAFLRKRRALESLAYAKNILKGSVSTIDDARLFDEETRRARAGAQEGTPTTDQGLPHISGYLPLPSSSPTTRLEAQRTMASKNVNPERRRSLGHSSSSPSLTTLSTRPSPAAALPRTPWTSVHDKAGSTHPPIGSTPTKPPQRSASSPSRPIQAETSAKPPAQYESDPLGVL